MNAWSVPGYREVRELGAGGAGRVVLATYMTTGAYVAIKYLREELRRDRRFLAGFRHEARIMVELNDPNIVRLYEYVEARDGAAIVMELVDGVSLRRILGEHGSTSPEAALVVLKGSLAGLSAAHATGIVHRDYKPENVLIQADGNSKLSDFGIATPSGSPETSAGTPPYMAPEQWYGGPAGPAADVYAATCVFYECLTGRRPYRADDLTALRMLHRSAPIPAADVPGSVRGLVTRGMAKNPADRPPTARAFIADLETAATAAYGSDWEQRGRRHLAELATLLALTFPLAAPAEPVEASTSLARTVLSERLARFAPRFAIGAAVLSAVVIAAVVAANRQTPVARDTLLTPPPHSAPAALPPAPDSAGTAAPTAPDETVPGETVPGETVPARDGAGRNLGGRYRTRRCGAGRERRDDAARPVRHAGGVGVHRTGRAAGTFRVTGTFRAAGERHPLPHGGDRVTRAGAGDRSRHRGVRRPGGHGRRAGEHGGRVLLTARFASGPSPDALAAAPSQTVGLRGATSYHIGLQQPFPSPACGTTVYRRVEVSTVPAARGGTRTHTRKLTGPACPAPAVEGVAIDDWDGKRAAVTVRTSGKGPVGVSSVFTRDGRTAASDTRTLSGHTSYSFTVPAGLGAVECGRRAVFGVASRPIRPIPAGRARPRCGSPAPGARSRRSRPRGPRRRVQVRRRTPARRRAPRQPESRRPESRSSEPRSPEPTRPRTEELPNRRVRNS